MNLFCYLLQVPDAKKDQGPVVNGQPYNLSVNLQGVRKTLCLEMYFVSEDDPTFTSQVFDLNKSKCTAFRRDDPTAAGTQFQRMIELPEGFKPGELPMSPELNCSSKLHSQFFGAKGVGLFVLYFQAWRQSSFSKYRHKA